MVCVYGFIGFDHLLRMIFGLGKTVHFFGPKNFIANTIIAIATMSMRIYDLGCGFRIAGYEKVR